MEQRGSEWQEIKSARYLAGLEATGKILAFVLREMKTPRGPTLPLPLCDALSQPLFISFIAPITFYDYFTSLLTLCVRVLIPPLEC